MKGRLQGGGRRRVLLTQSKADPAHLRGPREPSPQAAVSTPGCNHVTVLSLLYLSVNEAEMKRRLCRGWRDPYGGLHGVQGPERGPGGQGMVASVDGGERKW